MKTPTNILTTIYTEAHQHLNTFTITNIATLEKVEVICRCHGNRAAVRLLMSCFLAKLNRLEIDPRKPYPEIGTDDAFSGKAYDEYSPLSLDSYGIS